MDIFKEMLNRLQDHIDKDSTRVLLIFDNDNQYNMYIGFKYSNLIICTLEDLLSPHFLDSLRFKRYVFM